MEKNIYHMGQQMFLVSEYKIVQQPIEGIRYDKDGVSEYWIKGWWYPETGISDTQEGLIEKLKG